MHANRQQRRRERLPERGWCGGRRKGGGRRPDGELMHSAHHHGTRSGAVCGLRCAGRAAVRGSGSASPTASPLLAPEHSLRRTRAKPLAKDRAATGNLKPVPARRVEATPDPRAPSGHTQTLRVAPPRPSGMGFGLAMAARAFACGRIRIFRRGCPGGWREEEGRERQGGALGRGGALKHLGGF